jgi:D-3-phosphoglycerate dehydrogenase / 2-oxoglutarate reductase
MTSTVLLLKGAGDLELLRSAVGTAEVLEVGDLAELPEAATRATVILMRSGVRLGEQQLAALPMLQHVVRAGSGTGNIDLTALTRRGVILHRNPQAGAVAVAEWTLAAVLSLARRIPLGHNALAQGLHAKAACVGRPLAELDIAVWGAGLVGQAVGNLLAPFARRVAFARWHSIPPGLPQQSARSLVDEAAVHVIAFPLRPQTQQLFGEAFLARAAARRPFLICAGRIETLDLSACLCALEDQRLSGLALDAVEAEHIPLLRMTNGPLNLLATPHIGAQRQDVRSALDTWAVTLIARLIAEEEAPALPQWSARR